MRHRWAYILTGLLVLALCVYLGRGQIKHAAVAYEIYHLQIFTPPPIRSGESRLHRHWANAQFYWDFANIPLARDKRLQLFNPTLRPLVQEIARDQVAGKDTRYSMHIYREIAWYLNFTPDIATTRARIADLHQSFSQSAQQKLAGEQQSDGSWAMGINTWYLKLYYSVDEIVNCQPFPRYPFSFLDRINSPQKLTAQLDSDLHDDFTKTGVFNREELDETFSAITNLLFKKPTACYTFHPQLKDGLQKFVEHWQNPETGCWGQWLVDRQGRIWKMDDVGITFHVVSDLNGHVDHLDLITKRILQLDAVNFPAGIRFNGHYENHLNWDAVKIFRYAWPTLGSATRDQVRAEISRMLDWCLTRSYQPDGSFKVSDLDDTPGDAYRYGIWFLQETGYFNSKDRFWTDKNFPDSDRVRAHIAAKLKSTGLGDPGLREAYNDLQSAQQD